MGACFQALFLARQEWHFGYAVSLAVLLQLLITSIYNQQWKALFRMRDKLHLFTSILKADAIDHRLLRAGEIPLKGQCYEENAIFPCMCMQN